MFVTGMLPVSLKRLLQYGGFAMGELWFLWIVVFVLVWAAVFCFRHADPGDAEVVCIMASCVMIVMAIALGVIAIWSPDEIARQKLVQSLELQKQEISSLKQTRETLEAAIRSHKETIETQAHTRKQDAKLIHDLQSRIDELQKKLDSP